MAWTTFTSGVLLAGMAMAQPTAPPAPQVQTRSVVVASDGTGAGDAASSSVGTGSSAGAGSRRSVIRIDSIEPTRAGESAREVTWLGVSTEEASEALASQLGLKPGQGLVVVYVAPESPAAKAGLQKYDVIEGIGDQMLVDPIQFRKLVQMQKEGDTIKLTFYRAGKKQTVSATLSKRTEDLGMMSAGPDTAEELTQEMSGMSRGSGNGSWVVENRSAPQAFVGIDKKMINTEVQRSMEDARRAIQEAMRQSSQFGSSARPVIPAPPVAPLSPMPPMADVGDDATVTVTKDGASVKTIVKSDDTGVYVIVANPKKRLMVHDQDGKLLFDGEIETSEQQQKVPAPLWEKVKPLLQQMKPAQDAEPQPHAQSGNEPDLEGLI